MNKIQPYGADDGAHAFGDMLWRMITADNIDKHRLLMPIVRRARCKHVEFEGAGSISSMSFKGNVLPHAPGTRLKKNSDFSVDIVFSEPTTLAGKPVTGTLIEGCKAVGELIDIFRRTFAAT
ncbi:hypothetical protein FSB78_08460 [Sphingomonas ginsenosidivorax]|uniref:Uncharacterized protein n=1 Tax=Sphingomonas ginsenosidivorax TaxID=862135 RepID=A0A5C6UG11_9SPHN|nr:hypothetical protein [Sphingomonas ginsenosidivorax]TXC70975.1 hypothetical protein FSB78_08460 [Sphingomonas ginsenosidivorax]